MTECVWRAYVDHLTYLGKKPHRWEFKLYRFLKIVSHGRDPQPTYGGCVPFIVKTLAATHRLRTTVHCAIWRREHHLAASKNSVQRAMVKIGLRKWTWHSAYTRYVWPPKRFVTIELNLHSHHASFKNYLRYGRRHPDMNDRGITMIIILH